MEPKLTMRRPSSEHGRSKPSDVFVHNILECLGDEQVSHVGGWEKQIPVAVETQPVDGAAGAERQRVTCLVDDTGEGVCARDSGQTVPGTMAAVDEVG